jgi:hypothetical protein
MIRYKDGIITDGLRSQIIGLFCKIDIIFHEHGAHMTITCGLDGHPEDDPHSHGFAVDLRTHDLAIGDRSNVRDEIATMAGPDYTVLLEYPGGANEHIHVQYRKDLWHQIVAEEATQ